ncbi:MAG: hypothetical protein BGO98_11150 [Myxococcales bacterium 68-20]|nr:MAG: hypothetical protein BGO98_11150 [Myxococcales bacterium 68-20]
MSASSGETTTTARSRKSDGSWNVSDLPPPVGKIPNASRPESTASMRSRCPGRNVRTPKCSLATRSTSDQPP